MGPGRPDQAPTLSRQVLEASQRRRAEQRDGLRRRIHRAASDLLLEEGYAAFSLRRVAARIGYTATTIYRYYADKDDLVFSIVREGYEALVQTLRAADRESYDPFEQLRALGRAYVRFGVEHPVHYRIMFMQRPEFWDHAPLAERGGRERALAALREVVDRCIATGDTRDRDGEALSLALWSALHGVVAMALATPFVDESAAGSVAETQLALLVDGLREV
jgi:AcrR family transcriptional regulator